jgi:cytochrome c oxidase cbb3-type subunit 2
MNRVSLIFLGAFLVLGLSWAVLVKGAQRNYAILGAYIDDTENKGYPEQTPGLMAQGKLVYQDLGCAYCHTQQVRQQGLGSDLQRGWSAREPASGSVARDYLRESRVLLGSQRIGPDLRNVGSRQTDAAALYLRLYDPTLIPTAVGTNMPAYRFLFKTQKIGGQPSPDALALPAASAPAAGYEMVPTERAAQLVNYLLGLRDTYAYPELYKAPAAPAPAKAEAGGAKAPDTKPSP